METTYHEALSRVVEKRLKRFASVMPKVTESDDPEAVHDVRVWSRRLQQSLDALFPKPRSGEVKKVRRTLRRLRRALGGWRDCDVLIDLATGERKKARSDEARTGWELVEEFLQKQRIRQVAATRKSLLKHDLREFFKRLRRLLDSPIADAEEQGLARVLHLSIEKAWNEWCSALSEAQANRDAASLHAFRIATKQLRYRIELMSELGDSRAQPLLKSLKELQDALGAWHDRQALHRAISEALARPKVLRRKAGAARVLLSEIEKGDSEQKTGLEKILRLATDEPRQAELTAWIGSSQ